VEVPEVVLETAEEILAVEAVILVVEQVETLVEVVEVVISEAAGAGTSNSYLHFSCEESGRVLVPRERN
jgi:hypothetical protein